MPTNTQRPQDGLLIPVFEELFLNIPSARYFRTQRYQQQQTARPVIRKGDRISHIGLFASRLNEMQVPYESALEKDACTIFEGSPEIQRYISQPLAIELRYGGKDRTVFPDFGVFGNDHDSLIDIKFTNKTQSPKFQSRVDALAEFAELRGIHYAVMTEEDIRTPRLSRIRKLLTMARGKPSEALTETVWYWLQQLSPIETFADLWERTQGYPCVQAVLACSTVNSSPT